MQNCVSEFICNRIEEIGQTLQKKGGNYLAEIEKRNSLYDKVDPIIQSTKEITLSAGDCENFRNYFDQEIEVDAIMEKELYRQGFLDCARLLTMLGLLTGRTDC